MATSALLAELAQQYEKSQNLIDEIEESLKDRASVTPGPVRPEDSSWAPGDVPGTAAAGPVVQDIHRFSVNSSQPLCLVPATEWNPDPEPESAGTDEKPSLKHRRVSVVDLGSRTTAFRRRCPPRRAASLFSLAALQPTSALNRSNAADTEWQQQQPVLSPVGSVRSAAGAFGPSVSIMRRLSSTEQAFRSRHRGTAEGPKSPLVPSLPDILVQPLRNSQSQTLQLLQPSAQARQQQQQQVQDDLLLLDAPIADAESAMQARQPQLQASQPYGGEDGTMWARSKSRRASEYAFSPLRASSFTVGQLLQPPLSSTARNPAPGSSSPAHSTGLFAGAALPLSAQAAVSYSSTSVRRSSFTDPLGLRLGSKMQPPPLILGDPEAAGSGPLEDCDALEPGYLDGDSFASLEVNRASPSPRTPSASGVLIAAGSGIAARAVTGNFPGASQPTRTSSLPQVGVRGPPARAHSHVNLWVKGAVEPGNSGAVADGFVTAGWTPGGR